MTYQSYNGPGAQLVEHTLQTLLQRNRSEDVSVAIVAGLRHLRRVVGGAQGEAGLRRFDADLLFFYNTYRSANTQEKAHQDVTQTSLVASRHGAARLSAILIDAVENCLLLNAGGFYTSTDVLIDMLLSCLLEVTGGDADLGDLLLDVNSYPGVSRMADDKAHNVALH